MSSPDFALIGKMAIQNKPACELHCHLACVLVCKGKETTKFVKVPTCSTTWKDLLWLGLSSLDKSPFSAFVICPVIRRRQRKLLKCDDGRNPCLMGTTYHQTLRPIVVPFSRANYHNLSASNIFCAMFL